MKKGRVLSGMRPTGRLHLGHLTVLENWVKLQDEYDCYYTIVDWHAITTAFDRTGELAHNSREMLLDWLSVGLDPDRSAIFVQSHIKEHAELHLLLSMITPLSWLERVPTYKEQLQQFGAEGKDVNTYGFLGYPMLQAADILVYKADTVPVGEDQLPHLELCREIARRFNYLYQRRVFPEPQARLAEGTALLPGIDGRKMSKSYGNEIALSADREETMARVSMMITDPARIHRSDPGHPEICTAHAYHCLYNGKELADLEESCRRGAIGCVACKKKLLECVDAVLLPVRERRAEIAARPGYLAGVLEQGREKARSVAAQTMAEAREAMGLGPC